VLLILVFTSSLAGVLAFHNAASRYMFALGRDGFLPRRLSAVHAKHESPYMAGVAAFVIMGLVIAGFAIAGLDPLTNLASSTTGVGAIGIVSLLALTSLAVLVFFWRRGRRGWAHTVAPAAATLLLGSATVLALVNYDAITGSSLTLINSLPVLHLVVIIVAVGVAIRAKKSRPAAYRDMGRTQVD
jgi:amino acid transporter